MLQRTITVTGTVRRTFHHPEVSTILFVEPSHNKVEVAIGGSGLGWQRIWLTEQEVFDLIVSLEEALHKVPLVQQESRHVSE